jgi:hypothetical protein
MARSTATRLAAYERSYRQLAQRITEIGYIAAGSITQRYTRCGTTHCRCHADPPQPHGPYWQWTAKINGKTVTRRLSEAEARRYQQWIDNDRALRVLIERMRDVSAKATELIMKDTSSSQVKV